MPNEKTGFRAPAIFLQHGGGPMPLLGDPGHASLIEHMQVNVRDILLAQRPRAIVLVTAHWEEDVPTVSGAEKHELLFDYYGFPPEAYSVKYNARGSPEVATKVHNVLENAGLRPKMDLKRGWDHGVFVPLKLIVPDGSIPVVQLSVCSSQAAEVHLRMGEALAPLREENIAIIGSGMSFHNMRALRNLGANNVHGDDGINQGKSEFDRHLARAAQLEDPVARRNAFASWREWPRADWCHPPGSAEHWSPMLVVVGAGLRATTGVSMDAFKLWQIDFSNFVYV